MNEVNPVYNYTIREDGEFTKIIYKKTPISYKMAGPLCWYAIIPAFCLTMLFAPASLYSGIFTFLVFMVGTAYGVVALINLFRKSGEFKVSKGAVVVNDKTYQLDHVSSFLIKDPAGMYSSSTTVIINNNNPYSMMGSVANLSQGMARTGNDSRKAIQKHIRDAGYKIVIRFGAKDIPIATGLGETEADVLFQKVIEVAGYQTAR